MTGCPLDWKCCTSSAMWPNCASLSGCCAPSWTLRLDCRLYPMPWSRAATVRALTGCPCCWSSSARWYVDLHVQRSGEVGLPRVTGETRRRRSFVRLLSPFVRGFRPPPGRRCRSGDNLSPLPISRMPLRIVGKETPVARETRVAPPRPIARASAAAHLRRTDSVSPPSSAWYFVAMTSSMSMPTLMGTALGTRKLKLYSCAAPACIMQASCLRPLRPPWSSSMPSSVG